MQMKIWQYTQWEWIKKVGRLPVMKPSGIVLAVVPVLVHVYQLIAKYFPDFISSHEYLIIPKTLVYGYFSAIILIIAKAVYNLSCPELIKNYSPSERNRYIEENSSNANLKDELVQYIMRVYNKDTDYARSLLKIESNVDINIAVKNQQSQQLFLPARDCLQYVRLPLRLVCIILYGVGFALLIFKVFIPQLLRLYQAILFFSN